MKQLESAFDVGVNLSRSEATVSLVGAKDAIEKARAKLENDINKFESVEASLELRELAIEPEQVGMIVGKGGMTIKWIASTSGAAVNFQGLDRGYPQGHGGAEQEGGEAHQGDPRGRR